MKKEKFIYVDLNGLEGENNDFIPIKTELEFNRLKNVYPEYKDGMKVFLWTDDANNDGKYDPLVYSGMLVNDKEKNTWGIKINKNEIENLSKSKIFNEYSIKDIMGEEYEIEKKSHPELF